MIKAAWRWLSQSREWEQDVGTGITASGCDRGWTIIDAAPLNFNPPDSPHTLSVFSLFFYLLWSVFFTFGAFLRLTGEGALSVLAIV